MIVDSTALPEQVARDAVASAFQSAGQRCSALRLLCVQEDVAETMIAMVAGAMAELNVGDPSILSTDVGPIIDAEARENIAAYVAEARAAGRVIAEAQRDRKSTRLKSSQSCAYRMPSSACTTKEYT